jgi:hypothetical protein
MDINLHVYYRTSDKGENKERLDFIDNKVCLNNFIKEFPERNITLIADNVGDETMKWLETFHFKDILRTSLGNSGSFWFAYNMAMNLPEDDYVYFVENDYIHRSNSMSILLEGLKIADYVTLYDHPDKYFDGVNPQVRDGGENSKVLLTKSSHWKSTNSTTMTFASKVSTLKKDYFVFKIFTVGIINSKQEILRKFQRRGTPGDYQIFTILTKFKFRKLISSIPGFSTHGETKYLSPNIDWKSIVDRD